MPIRQTKVFKFFSSIKLAIWLLSFIAIFSVIGTLIPQNKESCEYISRYGQSLYDIFAKTGVLNIYSAWWFVSLLALLCLNLAVCLLNRFSLKLRLLGTLLSHLSILVILAGSLIGMFYGEKGYSRINEGETINSFISKNKKIALDFSLRLDDFIYEEHIDPQEKLLVYPDVQQPPSEPKGTCEMEQDTCDTQQPGAAEREKPLAEIPVAVGSQSEIADTGFRVKILRYVPDFAMDVSTKQVTSRSAEPKNPALEVELKSKDGDIKTFWIFAAYPDIHKQIEKNFRFKYQWAWRRPKDFISKVTVIKGGEELLKKDVRVNSPLRFGGYSFFQSSYDKEHLSWSGLQIVKDPGVIVVYFGFFLLILGLIIIFYINPLIKRR